VRDIEKLIQKLKHRRPPQPKRPGDADLDALQEDLLKLLGTKVVLSGNKNKGSIKIFYFSLDELNRLYGHIKGAKR
jgi:ParB family chromosome partitioning protein